MFILIEPTQHGVRREVQHAQECLSRLESNLSTLKTQV